MELTENRLKNIAAFCVLMENDGGIIGKAPSYIAEKFGRYCLSDKEEAPWGLDSSNARKFEEWKERWLLDETD